MNFTLNPKAKRAMFARFQHVCVIGLVMGFIFSVLKLLPISWDGAFVYSYSITFCIWLFIEISENCFFYKEQHQLSFTIPRVLSILFSAIFGHIVGCMHGDTYSGFSTFNLAQEEPLRYFGLVCLVALVAFSTTFVFIYRRNSVINKHLLKESNYKLLLSQLKPHTLLNTMANLRALIEMDPPKSIAMLDTLNNYLRLAVIASQVRWHPLANEFERLRAFLALMEIRMGLRLYYTCDCPDSLNHYLIPPFLLQPIVDSTIKQGIEPSIQGGAVHIQARLIDEHIMLTVSYTVNGSSPDALLQESNAIAIEQVKERLENTYGGHAKMTLTMKDCFTSTLQINLPIRTLQ